jgi:hypothetical protein
VSLEARSKRSSSRPPRPLCSSGMPLIEYVEDRCNYFDVVIFDG